MALTDLPSLIKAGAHRTLENVGAKQALDVPLAANYLSQRYGNELQVDQATLAVLTGRVQDALRSASITNAGAMPLEAEIPDMPGLDSGYLYTVIGAVRDPLHKDDPDKFVTFPMRFSSGKLLSYRELSLLADELLADAASAGQLRFAGALHGQVTLPGALAQVVSQVSNDEELPKIEVLSIYRGV